MALGMSAKAALGRLVPSQSALFVCDIQERFRPLICGYPKVVETASIAIRGAAALGLPVVVTEQYPKALGPTVPELMEVLPPAYSPAAPSAGSSHHKIFAKTLFSMYTPEVAEHMKIAMPNVKQVLLLGIETHVCVLQTALDLLGQGYEVHLLVDGVSSQRETDRSIAIQRLIQAGVLMSSSEMALFQLAKEASGPSFKAISALAKEKKGPYMVPIQSNL